MASITPTLQFPQAPAQLSSRKRRAWQRGLLTATSLLQRLDSRVGNCFGVLTYHRVSAHVSSDPAMLNVEPRRFRQQLEGLLRLGYQPYRLQQLIRMHRQGAPFPERAFALVFDDGFEDIYTNVRPIIEDLHVPATVFVATAYLDSDAPFPFATWPDTATSRPLTTKQCDQLAGGGFIDLGSHTHTHQDFRDRPSAFRADLDESLRMLRDRFDITSPSFSFPYGFTTPSLVETARDSGVACALTADSDLVRHDVDPFHWGRFGATNFDTPRSLAAKLDGWYSGCRAAWRRLRYGDVDKSQHAVRFTPPTIPSTD